VQPCRACGSWDIHKTILGDMRVSTSMANRKKRKKGYEQGMPPKTRWEAVRCQALSVSPCKNDGSRLCSFPSTRLRYTGQNAGTYSFEDGECFIALCKSSSGLERSLGEQP